MPAVRLRRLRKRHLLRELFSETGLRLKDFILPYFVVGGKGVKKPIRSMGGMYHLSVDSLIEEISALRGVKAILLFGIPPSKDLIASEAYRKEGIVQNAIKAVRKRFSDLVIISDVCLCAYTTHGHCGIVRENTQSTQRTTQYEIDNDATLKILTRIALSHADAGVDFVAPSAMMDGQVGAIREMLDKKGFHNVGILAYSAKYASNFYGPFREALDSYPHFGDRKTYQMDYRNSNEAMREISEDIKEGADIVMVKPALTNLDIIYRAKESFNVPIAAYNVSGEYELVKVLAKGDEVKEKEFALEVLTSIKRAGADLIVSYFVKELAKWLKQ